jgi:hypothetical protein
LQIVCNLNLQKNRAMARAVARRENHFISSIWRARLMAAVMRRW